MFSGITVIGLKLYTVGLQVSISQILVSVYHLVIFYTICPHYMAFRVQDPDDLFLPQNTVIYPDGKM